MAAIKRKARETHDCPARIIQDVSNHVNTPTQPSLPTSRAMRSAIERIRRKERIPEPRNLEELRIPSHLRMLNGSPFLVRKVKFGGAAILLFTSSENIRHLENSRFWVMDGTFQTVPVLFRQLYSIHDLPGTGETAKILPMVYALMTSKSEESYRKLFEQLNDFANELNVDLLPEVIITDNERGAIKAAKAEYPSAINKACLFHLGQCVWRRIQKPSLTVRYREDEDFCLKIRYFVALAFLPAADIPNAFDSIKNEFPEDAASFESWFEENYVVGRIQRTRGRHIISSPPLFPPELYDQIESGIPRTQNNVEVWHRRFNTLVGRPHIESRGVRGRPPSKPPKKSYVHKESRSQAIIADRQNRSVLDFVRGIAHNINL
ncbi:hypothetical protein J437_LFUL017440 [Ladona fulva]|uniref:MULE transposase domain-containing protein n=1 Tax=Ladona fulva TaxID=123851 RepID=A0A8K0KP87_LADFU|nr:hypothetical protein J437_LFUL017440 [Ladona fulva]